MRGYKKLISIGSTFYDPPLHVLQGAENGCSPDKSPAAEIVFMGTD